MPRKTAPNGHRPIKTLADLTPDAKNARRHSPRNVGLIETALGEVGAARSIVIDEAGHVLAGNATVEAAARVGIERVKVVEASGNEIVAVRRSGLTKRQKTRLALLDNAPNAPEANPEYWDAQVIGDLAAQERALLDGILRDDELAALTGQNGHAQADAEPQFNRAAELQKVWGTELGQLWRIGDHRLMCGDCTVRENVERVMGGERAGVMFTDPPYGIDISPASVERHLPSLDNDKLNLDAFAVFLRGFLQNARLVVYSEGFVCCDWRRYAEFQSAMKAEGWPISNLIVWNKETRAQNLNRFAFVHEFIAYSGPMDGPTIDVNVWTIPREYSDVHLTPKPTELIERGIKATGGSVYDPFLGSGTTLVACQNLGRRGYALEISPAYVAVALQRMADAFPGIEIELTNAKQKRQKAR